MIMAHCRGRRSTLGAWTLDRRRRTLARARRAPLVTPRHQRRRAGICPWPLGVLVAAQQLLPPVSIVAAGVRAPGATQLGLRRKQAWVRQQQLACWGAAVHDVPAYNAVAPDQTTPERRARVRTTRSARVYGLCADEHSSC